MKVYDFDKTIYKKDSTIEFYKYCLKVQPTLVKYLPKQIMFFLLWKANKVTKENFKEVFYSFLASLKDVNQRVSDFWEVENKNIENWYLEQQEESDVVISASPEFLLKGICRELNISKLIASKVNSNTGKLESPNCYGQEKVVRFRAEFPTSVISIFYSDSLSDKPLGNESEKFVLIKKGKVVDE